VRKANDLEIRVALGSPSGPQSCILRVWSRRGESDVYIAVREIGSRFKVSLHDGGECHAGLTSEFAQAEPSLVEALGGSRHQNVWTRRTHLGSQHEVPFVCVFPTSELRNWRDQPVSAPSLQWIAPPEGGGVVAVAAIFTGSRRPTSDWPGRERGDQLLGYKLLPNGEAFWLVYYATTAHRRVDEVLGIVRQRAATEQPLVSTSVPPRPFPGRRMTAFDFHKNERTLLMIDAAASSTAA
jgi:hypothetical protein